MVVRLSLCIFAFNWVEDTLILLHIRNEGFGEVFNDILFICLSNHLISKGVIFTWMRKIFFLFVIVTLIFTLFFFIWIVFFDMFRFELLLKNLLRSSFNMHSFWLGRRERSARQRRYIVIVDNSCCEDGWNAWRSHSKFGCFHSRNRLLIWLKRASIWFGWINEIFLFGSQIYILTRLWLRRHNINHSWLIICLIWWTVIIRFRLQLVCGRN